MVPAQVLTNAEEGRKSYVLVKTEPREMEEVESSTALNDAEGNNVSEIFDPLVNMTSNGGGLHPLVHPEMSDNDVNEEEVDVINWPGGAEIPLAENEGLDFTECSSSFEETFGSDNESKREELSDFEVESPFPASTDDSVIMNGVNRVFKKKKVTTNWRKCVSSIIWRCHWLELKMKELNSRSLRYDKELASYMREKYLQSKMVELDSSVSRSVPVAFRKNHNKVMKRRKRERIEEIIDVPSYTSNHPLFSYYENKRIETDGHSVDDDCCDLEENIKGNDENEWLVGSKNNDCHVEQLLLNIDVIQSRVLKLKTHFNKFMCSSTKETSSHGNTLSIDQSASYVHSASGSPRNNGEAMMAGILTPPFQSADDVLIDKQDPEEEYKNLGTLNHATRNIQMLVKKEETHYEDESIAPNVPIPRPGSSREAGSASQRTFLRPGYMAKRRGRKPKKRRHGAPAVTAPSFSAAVSWRSERLLKKRRLPGRKT